MSTHLSTQQLEKYRKHSMPPAELLDAGDHLVACEACREKVADAGKIDSTLSALREDFRGLARAPREHLSYQQLSAYVDDQSDEVEREIIDSHITVCAACKEELRDLFAFKDTLAAGSSATTLEKTTARETIWEKMSGWWRPRAGHGARWQLAGALAALLLVAMAAWFALRTRRAAEVAELKPTPSPTGNPSPSPLSSPVPSPGESPSPNAVDANKSRTPEVTPTPQSRPKAQPVDNSPATAAPVLALNDGGGQVALDEEGNLRGLESVSQPERTAVARVLRTGRLDVPSTLSDLKGRTGTLMGGAEDSAESFSVLSPAGTIVASERPAFRWRALEGATSYRVRVYDTDFNLVDSSPALTATQWTPARALQPGKVYTWQVAAVKDGSEVVSPAPPMPEARFKVLSRAQAEELTAALMKSGSSHLARGVIYTKAGLLAEAEREFEALARINPQSSLARRLLNNVRRMRGAK